MRVLIFGGSGFLGEYLAKEGISRGYDIRIFDRKQPPNDVEWIEGDILNEEQVDEAVSWADVVYNLTAMSDIDECIEKPKTAVEVNILGNVNVMNSCVNHKVKRFVFASSAYAGGNHGGIYSTTKKSNEMLVRDYHKFYGLEYTVLRYGTLYGVGAPPTNSICKYLTQAVKQGKIDYTGDGTEVREYIHVEDASKMSFDILESKDYLYSTVSLTGPNPTKTADLFTMIKEIMNGEIDINFNKNLTKGRTATHYRVSPYTYERDKVYKMNLDVNRDLGDTLIEILHDLDD